MLELLEEGCYIGMDGYPGADPSPEVRDDILKELLMLTYSDRICPSHDWTLMYIKAEYPEVEVYHAEKRKIINPHGYQYIKEVVIPRLRDLSVPEEILKGLCVNAPRNFFEGI